MADYFMIYNKLPAHYAPSTYSQTHYYSVITKLSLDDMTHSRVIRLTIKRRTRSTDLSDRSKRRFHNVLF